MVESILSNEKCCYWCHTTLRLDKHHIFYGAKNRSISDKEGCWVYLCKHHHTGYPFGVHHDHEADERLKRKCQIVWMEKNGKTIEDFRALFGKNYI